MDPEEKQGNYKLAERLLSEQDFGAAAIAGIVAMILAAGVYGVVKSLSEGPYYGILAAGIGIVIGFATQFLGRGIARKFAVVASVYALLGRMLGNMFAVVMHVARAIADLMFWVIGIGGAAHFARRPLTREEGLALYTYEMRR